MQQEIENGIRQARPFELKAEIRRGSWFIVGGQKAYVAAAGEIFTNAQGKSDARLRVIFDNGTESNLLMRSLQRALNRTTRAVASPIPWRGRYFPVAKLRTIRPAVPSTCCEASLITPSSPLTVTWFTRSA